MEITSNMAVPMIMSITNSSFPIPRNTFFPFTAKTTAVIKAIVKPKWCSGLVYSCWLMASWAKNGTSRELSTQPLNSRCLMVIFASGDVVKSPSLLTTIDGRLKLCIFGADNTGKEPQ